MFPIVKRDRLLECLANDCYPGPGYKLIQDFDHNSFKSQDKKDEIMKISGDPSFMSFSTKFKEMDDTYVLVANEKGRLHYLPDYSEKTLQRFYFFHRDNIIGIMSHKEVRLLNSKWKKFIAQKYPNYGLYCWRKTFTSDMLKEFVAVERQKLAQQLYPENDDLKRTHLNSSGSFNTTGGDRDRMVSLVKALCRIFEASNKPRRPPLQNVYKIGNEMAVASTSNTTEGGGLFIYEPISEIIEGMGIVLVGRAETSILKPSTVLTPSSFMEEWGKLWRNKSHASSGDGGSREPVKPKAKQEPLTNHGKSPACEIVEENASGGSPMQGHEPSDKPIGQGTAVASASNTNDGRVPNFLKDMQNKFGSIIHGRGERDNDEFLDFCSGSFNTTGGDGGSMVSLVKAPCRIFEASNKPRRLPLQDVYKIGNGTAVASTSNTNDGRVQMLLKAVNEDLLVGSSRIPKNLEKPQPNIYHAGSGRGTAIELLITGPNTNGYGNNDKSGFVDHGTTVSEISKGMEELQRNKFMPPGTAIASTSNTNEGRVPEDVKKQLRKLTGSIIRGHVERDGGDELVDLEMGLDPYMMIMYTEAKPKSGIQDIAKVFLAATFTCGIGLANMAKGGSVWGPIYWLAVSAIAIGFLSSLAVILMEEKHPKLATYAAYVMILAISVGFFSAFLV